MTTGSPPLRFVALVLGGWVCIRAAMLAPGFGADESRGATRSLPTPTPRGAAVSTLMPQTHPATLAPWPAFSGNPPPRFQAPVRSSPSQALPAAPASIPALPAAMAMPFPLAAAPGATAPAQSFPPPFPVSPLATPASRWSGSAWAFGRRGGAAPLAAGGMLGGSQAGARLAYRINGDAARPLALSGRLYSPLHDSHGAEAALGLEWKPFAAAPVRLLAERRQALGRNGRSAFALIAFGGLSAQPLPGGLDLDLYAQTGVVGAKSRDLFVDGAARINLPVAEGISIGAGLWGAAQPGVSRLDAGPQVSIRLPFSHNVRLHLDWRHRLAGDAKPGSGPSLTIATDF